MTATAHQLDGNTRVLTEAPALIQRMDYNGDGLPIYIGLAFPGSASSEAVWQIRRFTYSGTNVELIEFADLDTEFDNVWDSRTTLTYG